VKGRTDPHSRYRELIAARLDKPLTRVELRTLNSHLKTCAACQSIESEYRAQRDLLRGLAAPIPPRDLWARTSASLDHEVARSYRAHKWRRRVARGSRTAQPTTALLTAIAAVGVSAAVALLQLAPAVAPIASLQGPHPTPLSISPLQLLLIGQGRSDVAVYQTDVNQVCPVSGPLDCVQAQNFVRTPIGLPSDMRAGNIALSPGGKNLAVVGHKSGGDMIGVVTMPDGKSGDKGNKNNQATDDPGSSGAGGAPRTDAPNQIGDPQAVATTPPNDDTNDQPSGPPASAVPGLAVLSILDNVQSTGAPPDWSANGEMLAFSAMPDDGSSGPDVYIWSPGDAKATPITSDHATFFASWSGNRIVVSRVSPDSAKPHDFVIDPNTLEQRAVGGPQLWLPTVNTERTQAIGWFGQLDTSGPLPAPRSGALYLMDWASVDPFGAAAPPPDTDNQTDDSSTPQATNHPISSTEPDASDQATPSTRATSGPGNPALVAATRPPATPTPTPTPTDDNSISDPQTTTSDEGAFVPSSLTPLEPDRDPRAAPVVDWQARWSSDAGGSEVLGVWIADSDGSPWGRLAVLAVDPATQLVSSTDPLLPMTMAKRGFSLGQDQVAWVGPAEDNLDGELRIRTWGSDGVGGLRLKAPEQEEVTPAS